MTHPDATFYGILKKLVSSGMGSDYDFKVTMLGWDRSCLLTMTPYLVCSPLAMPARFQCLAGMAVAGGFRLGDGPCFLHTLVPQAVLLALASRNGCPCPSLVSGNHIPAC